MSHVPLELSFVNLHLLLEVGRFNQELVIFPWTHHTDFQGMSVGTSLSPLYLRVSLGLIASSPNW